MTTPSARGGPLEGIRVVELNGVGPTPFAGMLLSDLGADVVRVDRTAEPEEVLGAPQFDLLARGRRSVALNLKRPDGVAALLELVRNADVFLEGYRPGVCERLGVGPADCDSVNPRLIYARMTGWGQTGPLSRSVGHDINYLAVAGGLYPIGVPELPPPPPLNYVADFGGGGMLVVVGILAALTERTTSGEGQVIDAAMVDGVALQMAQLHGLQQGGSWSNERGDNKLDGGAPFYRCYATKDGKFVAVSALEGPFYAELLSVLGLDATEWPQQDKNVWPILHKQLEDIFLADTREAWTRLFEGTNGCVSPVLEPTESTEHPYMASREAFIDVAGLRHPAPAPRFSRTAASIGAPPVKSGAHTINILEEAGLSTETISAMLTSGSARQA